MLDRNQIKVQGVKYARSLQMLFKTVGVFSVDHAAAQAPFQTSFDTLNALLKETRQFTVGFVDQRLLLNNILTTEKALAPLENEFLKRGIGAITFEIGMTLAMYKRGVGVLARPGKEIETFGGLSRYLEQNPLRFIRVFPASKNQQRTESGDTILDTDSESFLMAKAFAELQTPGTGLQSLDSFLQASGIAGQGGGQDSGVGEGSGSHSFGNVTEGPAPMLGSGGAGIGYGSEHGGGGGGGDGTPGGGGPGGGGRGGAAGFAASAGGPANIQQMVEGFFTTSLMDSKDAPQRSYMELARIIKDMRPEFVLSSFPPARREELRSLPPEQMAAEVIEDTAVKWAVDRLASAPTGAEAVIVEEEVIRVLLRSLQSTHVADRLGRKLAEFVKQYSIPPTTYNRIQDELSWVVLSLKHKTAKLLEIEHYAAPEFRRLMEHLKELIKQTEFDGATELGNHYFTVFDWTTVEPRPEEISRIPELLRAMGGVRTDFWDKTATRLCEALTRPSQKEFLHRQIVNALVVLCKTAALYEDFSLIRTVGNSLEKTAADDPKQHLACCGNALPEMLTVHAVDRILELFLQKRDDMDWARTAAALLRWSGTPAIAKVFQQLEDEQGPGNRIALLRLIGRIGPPALNIARQQLASERWYVVRNACKLLGELKDPAMLLDLAPVLHHSDPRVQKAAATGLMDSRDPARGPAFAEALPHLHPEVLHEVLTEILFLKDPACLPALEKFIFEHEHEKAKILVQVVQAVGAIPGLRSLQVVARVLNEVKLDHSVRRAALSALEREHSPEAYGFLEDFARKHPTDAFASECTRLVKAAHGTL